MARASTQIQPATIVIVDDDPVALGVMEEIIAGIAGSSTAAFSDPAEALAWCQACSPDVIVSDYQMPDMDGLQLLEHLRAEERLDDVPIMLVTATNDREVRQRALEVGANDFLGKPFDAAEVAARITNMILVHQAQRGMAVRAQELAFQVGLATTTMMEREREVILRPRTIEAVLAYLKEAAGTPFHRDCADALRAALPEMLAARHRFLAEQLRQGPDSKGRNDA